MGQSLKIDIFSRNEAHFHKQKVRKRVKHLYSVLGNVVRRLQLNQLHK